MRHKQRAPSAKSKPTTSFAWTPTPFQTVVELPSRPGTARPALPGACAGALLLVQCHLEHVHRLRM